MSVQKMGRLYTRIGSEWIDWEGFVFHIILLRCSLSSTSHAARYYSKSTTTRLPPSHTPGLSCPVHIHYPSRSLLPPNPTCTLLHRGALKFTGFYKAVTLYR